MTKFKRVTLFAKLLLTASLLGTTSSAQQRRPAAPKAPAPVQPAAAAPTFDTFIAADSYKLYGEARGVGQLIRSPGVNDLLEPVMKLAAPPKEFKTLVKWLTLHADALVTSRMLFAAWPSRSQLPQVIFAIEFPSVEEAQKFEPQLKEFLPKFLPTPQPESSPSPGVEKNVTAEAKPKEPPRPQYVLKQSGSLVVISDTPFTFKNLRPAGSRALLDDPNFRLVHDRFNSDSIFLYFDIHSIEKDEQERAQRLEEEYRKQQESEAANPGKQQAESELADQKTAKVDSEELAPAEVTEPVSPEATPDANQPQPQATLSATIVSADTKGSAAAPKPDAMSMAFESLSRGFFAGRPKWPEAIGVALVFDADSYALRALLVNSPDVKGNAIPFIPQLISGPALIPESPSILPADTEFFVTASLDYPQIYEGILKTLTGEQQERSARTVQTIKASEPESPFASYEKSLGLKIKEDLLPLLGSEVAFSIPVQALNMRTPAPSPSPRDTGADGSTQEAPATSGLAPVIAIAVKDKEALRTLLPKMIDTMSVKGASLLAETEKQDDTELVSYADFIAYAFVGDFLVMSPDTRAVRHVVDSYLNHAILAADSHFKNYTRWQPRQVLGQIYVSPALMESYNAITRDANSPLNDQLREFMSRISPTPQPVTYALSNEGMGPLHELHIPKNLVMFLIAGISSETNQPPLVRNEAFAKSMLRMIVSAEATYEATEGNGSFATLDQLSKAKLINKDMMQNFGYRIDLAVVGTKYEVTAVPIEYGKTGKLSFFIDESAVLRGGDHGGGPATVADNPVQ
jgi:uncharacterized protein DUF3352